MIHIRLLTAKLWHTYKFKKDQYELQKRKNRIQSETLNQMIIMNAALRGGKVIIS